MASRPPNLRRCRTRKAGRQGVPSRQPARLAARGAEPLRRSRRRSPSSSKAWARVPERTTRAAPMRACPQRCEV
eukprot:6350167-Prymnesium_polylepis.1